MRDKAEDFKATGRILTLNTNSGLYKLDNLVSSELKAELKAGVAPLLAVPDAITGGHCDAESINPARIQTWGVEWSIRNGYGWPSRAALLVLENERNNKAFKSVVYRIREYLLWPEDYLA